MESKEVLLNGGVSNGLITVSYGNGLEQVNDKNGVIIVSNGNGLNQVNGENGFEKVDSVERERESLADEVLEDLEEYWEDINDRLMISRMVSDSVIKGMVTAVEQEAAETITAKEMEVANFKECLRSCEVGTGKFEPLKLPIVLKACEVANVGRFSSCNDNFVKHDKMRVDLHGLRSAAREQFEKTKNMIDSARGCNSIKKIGSGSELVGLGGILQEKKSESWLHVDKMLESLNSTVETVCSNVDELLLSSKISLCEWQHELDISGKIEGIVMQSVLKNLQEDFEEKLWQQNAQSCRIRDVNWLEKFNDISVLRSQLDAIVKSLSLPESGLVSPGSLELDHLHHRTLSSVVSLPTSFSEGNGILEASDAHVHESYEFQQLKHMSKEELVNYFNNIITKIRRDHEIDLQKKTEKYFRLKREIMKERGSIGTHRQDEEFDVLRKKIPEVIFKLEDFLLERERFPTLTDNMESLGKLKDRVESLLSENRELRDCLIDKKKEVECLEAQVSSAAGKLLQHSLAEENMGKHVADLKSTVEDSRIEASLNEEVYKCALRELIKQMRSGSEDSDMESLITQEIFDIILREAAIPAETRGIHEIEDSDIESLISQGLSGLIFREAIKEAEGKLKDLHCKVLTENENKICLETKFLEKENELRLEVEEKERLKQEILVLGTTMEQKEKLAMDLSISLSHEREQLELASGELGSLRENLTQQQTLVAENNRARELLSAELLEAVDQIEINEIEIHKLTEKLDQTKKVLTETKKERNIAFDLAQERLDKLLLSEAKEEELKKELELAIDNIHRLCEVIDNFECRISGAIRKNNLRLEDTTSHLTAVTNMASELRRTGLVYKQKLERKCADLQIAEAEVDLLGDEVDALLRLLEKIYIALDHYSPILKHYPGVS
ncbi:hypothetical protein RD792_003846 [Penstemon davidsonii]|uniref:WPP domain-associated protein n=1 Tax=Penstemon davidsonii TaxID=160366 RepID=A0ABR0DFU0_9LAMI|nr:hypothetical protein RD792_003846 [Penstemon davidsonii]